MYTYGVEPLSNGHIGTDYFIHYREVVLFWSQNVLPLYNVEIGALKVSFIQIYTVSLFTCILG